MFAMRIALIAVPYDSARRGERMGAGPARLLDAGLEQRLTQAGHHVTVQVVEAPSTSWRAEIRTAFDLAAAVADRVRAAVADGARPLVLSGNCGPAAHGCLAGLASPAQVFWFDAHGDFNTPETTVGGFLDGMSLATAAGRCWRQLTAALPGFDPVPEESITLIGARDLDPLEADALRQSAVRQVSVAGLRRELPEALRANRRAAGSAYLHLDLDVLDPREGRINSYAAPGGLNTADIAWAVGAISAAVRLEAASLTAYDPGSDTDGRGCEAALSVAVALAGGFRA